MHTINGNTDTVVAGYVPFDASKHKGYRKSIIFKFLQKTKILFDGYFSCFVSGGGKTKWDNDQLYKCIVEFQGENILFEYNEIEQWFTKGDERGFPWQVNSRQGKQRMEDRIEKEIQNLNYIHVYEPYQPEIHEIAYSN